MKKEVDSSTVRNNLKNNLEKERYWKIKIYFIITLIASIWLLSKIFFREKQVDFKKANSSVINKKNIDSIQNPNQSIIPKSISIEAEGLDVTEVYNDFKKKVSILNGGYTYSFISCKPIFENGFYKFSVNLLESPNSYKSFTLVFNPLNTTPFSMNNVINKNPGSQILENGIISIHEYYLIGLK